MRQRRRQTRGHHWGRSHWWSRRAEHPILLARAVVVEPNAASVGKAFHRQGHVVAVEAVVSVSREHHAVTFTAANRGRTMGKGVSVTRWHRWPHKGGRWHGCCAAKHLPLGVGGHSATQEARSKVWSGYGHGWGRGQRCESICQTVTSEAGGLRRRRGRGSWVIGLRGLWLQDVLCLAAGVPYVATWRWRWLWWFRGPLIRGEDQGQLDGSGGLMRGGYIAALRHCRGKEQQRSEWSMRGYLNEFAETIKERKSHVS